MAGVIQYLSAKVGWLTGESLPALVGAAPGKRTRLVYWVQAEAVAMATDIAEIVGGALALQLLFGPAAAARRRDHRRRLDGACWPCRANGVRDRSSG